MKGYYGASASGVQGAKTMSVEKDMAVIAAQEQTLQFETFGAEMAWRIGCWLREEALKRKAAMLVEVQVAGRVLFCAATDGVTASQADWIRRKRNTVMWFGKSTYSVGLKLELSGRTLENRYGMSLSEYAVDGGGFPIALRGTGVIGSVIASGLTQREDHGMVVEALAAALGKTVEALEA